MHQLQRQFNKSAVEIKILMSNYFPYKIMYVIIYQCSNLG